LNRDKLWLQFKKILLKQTVEIIRSICIYDMLGCIIEEAPLPVFELTTFLAILRGTISVVVILKKKRRSRFWLLQYQFRVVYSLNLRILDLSHEILKYF